MVRNYQWRNTRSGIVDEEAMSKAIQDVTTKILSVRKDAQMYGVKPSTLESRLTKIRKGASSEPGTSQRFFRSKYASSQVFSSEEESMLNEYITNCSKMHYGLTLTQVRKLAYEFGKANHLKFPSNWDKNQMAGNDWLASYVS